MIFTKYPYDFWHKIKNYHFDTQCMLYVSNMCQDFVLQGHTNCTIMVNNVSLTVFV